MTVEFFFANLNFCAFLARFVRVLCDANDKQTVWKVPSALEMCSWLVLYIIVYTKIFAYTHGIYNTCVCVCVFV